MPRQRLAPALPIDCFSWSTFPTWPTVAMHSRRTMRISVLGMRRVT
jgi:hypothetical protein